MKTAIDRDELVALLERFWGTSKVRRLTAATDELPTAEVICFDMYDVNEAVAELVGTPLVTRVEIDLDGATLHFNDGESQHIPFSDALDAAPA